MRKLNFGVSRGECSPGELWPVGEPLRKVWASLLAVLSGAAASLPAQFDATTWQRYLDQTVDLDLYPGVIAARLEAGNVDYWSSGSMDAEGSRPPAPDTIFQLGEVTGIFTVAATYELVKAKELSWNTKLAVFLPAQAQPPAFEDMPIRLSHLATHSSDLPPLPLDLELGRLDPQQPFAEYGPRDLYRSLAIIARLNQPPGTRYQFSTFGMGALGHVLSLRTNQAYGDVIRNQVLEPLGLDAIAAELDETQRKRLATGFKGQTQVPPWDYGALEGAGQLMGSAEALIAFLKAAANFEPSPLEETFRQMRKTVLPAEDHEDTWMAFGWHVTTPRDAQLFWQSGLTGGYAAFIGYDLLNRRAVVVLANAGESVEPLGFHLLSPRDFPLPPLFETANLAPETVARLSGVYETETGLRVIVRQEDNRLYVKIGDAPEYRVYAESPLTFFYRNDRTRLRFAESRGPAPVVTVMRGFQAVPAKRVAGAAVD
ncbi:MAG: serine hydrolase domain-containing protein [Opitutales bacterium]